MSFGFSDFVGAPKQFEDISNEVRSLSIILQDVDVVSSEREFDDQQKKDLKDIVNACQNVLNELKMTLNKYSELESKHKGINNRAKRAWERLMWEPDDIRELRGRITLNVTLLSSFSDRFTKDNVVKLVRCQDNQERQAILDWLTPIDYANQQNDFIERRQAGTGQWVLNSIEYQAWLITENQTLLCLGIPGAGKTILTSIIISNIHERFRDNSTIGIAYIYCDYRRQGEQKINNLLASLLKQLSQERPVLADSVKALYNFHKNKRTRPSFDEILRALQHVIRTYSRVFVIVDALDECQVSNGYRQELLSSVFNLRGQCGVNLFATSRPISSIEKEFEGMTVLEIRASEGDVRRYLEGRMSRLPGFVNRSLELQEEIKTEIIKAIDGMFLLAQLHFDSLIGKRAPKAIRAALRNLATGSEAYDHAYENAMERINGQVEDEEMLAKQVLSWITCAKRPLSSLELQHALAIGFGMSSLDDDNIPDVEDMVSVCAGLVTVDKESHIIRLVHYTTQIYFERTRKSWFLDAETHIANSCLTYILFDAFNTGFCRTDEELEERLQKSPLYNYAARNWGHHARIAAAVTEQLIICLLEDEAKLTACVQAMAVSKRYPLHLNYCLEFSRHMTGVHVAAWFGLKAAVDALLKCSHLPALKDSCSQTPLALAALNGHEGVVKRLLEEVPDIDTKNDRGETALFQAISAGQAAVVQLLLEAGADVLCIGSFGRTAIHYAAEAGNNEVMRLLLDRRHIIESIDNHGCTALHWAIAGGQMTIIGDLLKKEANIEARDSVGSTPLHYASNIGSDGVAKLLLENGADVQATRNNGDSVLHVAASNGDEVVASLLLDGGVSMEISNKKGQVPLLRASQVGNENIVRFLIKKGANLTSQDVKGKTALHEAAWHGHASIVRLLLDNGADVGVQDQLGKTVLQYAASNNRRMIINILVDNGADLNTRDHEGLTALHKAAKGGHSAVIKHFLALGALTELKSNAGQTALDLARIKWPWNSAETQQLILQLLDRRE